MSSGLPKQLKPHDLPGLGGDSGKPRPAGFAGAAGSPWRGSVGIEDVRDIIADLDHALEATGEPGKSETRSDTRTTLGASHGST